jgi:hypothetical protein
LRSTDHATPHALVRGEAEPRTLAEIAVHQAKESGDVNWKPSAATCKDA